MSKPTAEGCRPLYHRAMSAIYRFLGLVIPALVICTVVLWLVSMVIALGALNDWESSDFGDRPEAAHAVWLLASSALSVITKILILLGAGAVLRLRLQQLQHASNVPPVRSGKDRLRKLAIASVVVAVATAGAAPGSPCVTENSSKVMGRERMTKVPSSKPMSSASFSSASLPSSRFSSPASKRSMAWKALEAISTSPVSPRCSQNCRRFVPYTPG